MTEENENFKIPQQQVPQGPENPVIDGNLKLSSGVSVGTVAGGGGGGGDLSGPIWTSPAPPPPVDDFNYYFNSALSFQQNGYFFQNFGPPPNMGTLL